METAERAVESLIVHKEQRKATAGDIPAVGVISAIGYPCFDSMREKSVVDINISSGGDEEAFWLIEITGEVSRYQPRIRGPYHGQTHVGARNKYGVVDGDKHGRRVAANDAYICEGSSNRVPGSASARHRLIERLTYPVRGVE